MISGAKVGPGYAEIRNSPLPPPSKRTVARSVPWLCKKSLERGRGFEGRSLYATPSRPPKCPALLGLARAGARSLNLSLGSLLSLGSWPFSLKSSVIVGHGAQPTSQFYLMGLFPSFTARSERSAVHRHTVQSPGYSG